MARLRSAIKRSTGPTLSGKKRRAGSTLNFPATENARCYTSNPKGTTIQIKTGCWYATLPADHIKVGISRGTPAGYRQYRQLAPGPWFKSCATPAEYLNRYNPILNALDPAVTAKEIIALGDGRIPVLCCFEKAADICDGRVWCHRHIVAQWLEDTLSITVEEFGAPDLDRWAMLRRQGIIPPSYR